MEMYGEKRLRLGGIRGDFTTILSYIFRFIRISPLVLSV